MVLTGIAIYCTYGLMGSPVYDRLVAHSRLEGTATLLIFLSDMSGYVGSIAITLYSLFSAGPVSYMDTFVIGLVGTAALCVLSLVPVFFYFQCVKLGWYLDAQCIKSVVIFHE